MRICYVEAALGNDLTDSICRIIHKDAQAAVNAEIQMYDFEGSVLVGVEPKYEIICDDYDSVVIKLGKDRFVLFHHYSDCDGPGTGEACHFLADVTVHDKEIRVERLYYVLHKENEPSEEASSMPEVKNKWGKLWYCCNQTFQILMEKYYGVYSYTIDYDYINNSMHWKNGYRVCEWFLKKRHW
jgi:hypothetical protein